jgi:hypothetical protein
VPVDESTSNDPVTFVLPTKLMAVVEESVDVRVIVPLPAATLNTPVAVVFPLICRAAALVEVVDSETVSPAAMA